MECFDVCFTVSYKKNSVVNFQRMEKIAFDTYVSTSVEPFQTKIDIEIKIIWKNVEWENLTQ